MTPGPFSSRLSVLKGHQYDEAKRAFEGQLSVDSANAMALTYLGDIALKDEAQSGGRSSGAVAASHDDQYG